MNSKKSILALFVIALAILGFTTVIPNPVEPKVSHLGYNAVCPFAPFSTGTLFILVAAFYLGFRKAG